MRSEITVSHLCALGGCISPGHWVLENLNENGSRRSCHKQDKCVKGCSPPCWMKPSIKKVKEANKRLLKSAEAHLPGDGKCRVEGCDWKRSYGSGLTEWYGHLKEDHGDTCKE